MKELFFNEDLILRQIEETGEYEISFFKDGHYLSSVIFKMSDLYDLEDEFSVVRFS